MNEVKYDRHEQEWDKALNDAERKRVADTWLETDNLDYWRHTRIRKPVIPFVEDNLDASWLTVGDGRYGADASYLLSLGLKSVHASDMHDALLRVGRERGFIKDYSAQNAEHLTFADQSFDYVYCKEAFHHFPRPFIALYEMFRVARRAVILTEPRDEVFHNAWLKRFLKKVLGKARQSHSFEPIGNYVYAISERELEKFLLGMHHRVIAYTGCGDLYIKGSEFVPLAGGTGRDKRIRLMMRGGLKAMDALEKFGLHPSVLLTAALFKQPPSDQLCARLKAAGWTLKRLPANPYLDSAG